jgi:hypothetical protein
MTTYILLVIFSAFLKNNLISLFTEYRIYIFLNIKIKREINQTIKD